jgi:dihydrolipoamide dehydrogenase
MLKRKDNIVGQLTSGIRGLFKKNKVTLLSGMGSFVGREDEKWKIAGPGRDRTRAAKHVVVATGSRARHLPGIRSR